MLKDRRGSEDAQWVDAILRNSQVLQLRLDHLLAAVRNTSSDAQVIDLPSLLRESVQLVRQGTARRRIGGSRSRPTATGRLPAVSVDPGPVDAGRAQPARQRPAGVRRAPGAAGGSWCEPARAEEEDGSGSPSMSWTMGREFPRLTSIASSSRSSQPGKTGPATACTLPPRSSRNSRAGSRCCNNREGGATFTIWLPADRQEPSSESLAGGQSRFVDEPVTPRPDDADCERPRSCSRGSHRPPRVGRRLAGRRRS